MQEQLVSFIEEYLRKGSTKDEIKSALIRVGGWTSEEVDQSFAFVESKRPSPSINIAPTPIRPPMAVNQASVAPIEPKPIMATFKAEVSPVEPRPIIGFQTPAGVAPMMTPSDSIPPRNNFSAEIRRPPVTQIQPMPSSMPASSGGAMKAILISLVIFIILGAGGAAVYFLYYLPLVEEVRMEAENNIVIETPVEENVLLNDISTTTDELQNVSGGAMEQTTESLPSSNTEIIPEEVPAVAPVQEAKPFVND